jgi:hypothetical protein
MGYTGLYVCPVAKDFSVKVTEDRYQVSGDPNGPKQLVPGTSAAGRVAVVAHGLAEHGLNWNDVSNETFRAPVEARD